MMLVIFTFFNSWEELSFAGAPCEEHGEPGGSWPRACIGCLQLWHPGKRSTICERSVWHPLGFPNLSKLMFCKFSLHALQSRAASMFQFFLPSGVGDIVVNSSGEASVPAKHLQGLQVSCPDPVKLLLFSFD